MNQHEKAAAFLAMHQRNQAFILPNCWDAFSAGLLAQAGFPAIATASAALSWVHGVPDGEYLSLEQHLSAILYISRSVDIPVSADLESGFSDIPEEVGENVASALQAGAVGVNLEDSRGGALIPAAQMVANVQAARKAADVRGLCAVINARTDVFLLGGELGGQNEAVRRANLYRAAGADCLFIPAAPMVELHQICQQVDGPVNALLMGTEADNLAKLETLGVRRVSTGPRLAQFLASQFSELAVQLQKTGDFSFMDEIAPHDQIEQMFRR